MAKRTWFTAAAGANGTADIAIYDEIGYFGVSAKDFRDALDGLGPVHTINLRINSPGGEVFDGVAVHNMLARNPAKVNVTVDGVAASIASIIAMAGDHIAMPENAMMFVHNPAGFAMGMASDMQDMADALNRISNAMAATYVRRTGQTPEAITGIMAGPRGLGTWMTAQEAKDKGFADEVAVPARIAARFDLSRYPHAPDGISAAAPPTYDPDGDGDDDALEAIGYLGQAIDNIADAVGCLTGTGDPDDEGESAPATAELRKAMRAVLAGLKQPRATAAAAEWIVGAGQDLPIDAADIWDGTAAAERILDAAGFNGGTPDAARARRGFLVCDSGSPGLKGAYKLPFADIIGGELRATAGGLRAAAQLLPNTDIPDGVRAGARGVLDAYAKRREERASAEAAAALRDHAAQIAAICRLAGAPERAARYIEAGKNPDEVRAELRAIRSLEATISAHNNPMLGAGAAADWNKTIDKINARSTR